MNNINANDVTDAYLKLATLIEINGTKRLNAKGETKEILNAWIKINRIENPIIQSRTRNIDMQYVKTELDWYEQGNPDTSHIGQSAHIWKDISDSNNTANSNYGKLILKDKFSGKSQYEWCKQKLQNNPSTRQAIMNYSQPQFKYPNNKDFVCTISQQFMLNKGKLDTIVLMRSNDLIYGFSYDIIWFDKIHNKICDDTGLEKGDYYHYATTMHVYPRHYKMIKQSRKEFEELLEEDIK